MLLNHGGKAPPWFNQPMVTGRRADYLNLYYRISVNIMAISFICWIYHLIPSVNTKEFHSLCPPPPLSSKRGGGGGYGLYLGYFWNLHIVHSSFYADVQRRKKITELCKLAPYVQEACPDCILVTISLRLLTLTHSFMYADVQHSKTNHGNMPISPQIMLIISLSGKFVCAVFWLLFHLGF